MKFAPALALCLWSIALVQGFSPIFIPKLGFNRDVAYKVGKSHFCTEVRLPTRRSYCGSLGLRAMSDPTDEDDLKWLPISSGPSVEPTPGSTVMPIFPLGATVYVVSQERALIVCFFGFTLNSV
jgi:hypothetical protein